MGHCRPRPSALLRLLLILLCVLSICSHATAAPAPVEFAVEGPEAHQQNVRDAVADAMRGLDVKVIEVAHVPTVDEALDGAAAGSAGLVRLRVDLLEDQLRLVVLDRTGKGTYVRSIPYSEAQAPLAYEQVSQILRSTVIEMMGREVEAESDADTLARDEPDEEVVVPTESPPPPRPSVGFDLAAAGAVLFHSHELPVIPSIELSGGGHWGGPRHQALARLSGGYQWSDFQSDEVAFSLWRVPLYILLGYRLHLENWRLETLAGAGISFVRLQPDAAGSELEVEDGGGFNLGTLRLALGFERRLSSSLWAFVALRTDFYPSRTRIVVEDDGVNQALITPFAVQPSLALGLSFGN